MLLPEVQGRSATAIRLVCQGSVLLVDREEGAIGLIGQRVQRTAQAVLQLLVDVAALRVGDDEARALLRVQLLEAAHEGFVNHIRLRATGQVLEFLRLALEQVRERAVHGALTSGYLVEAIFDLTLLSLRGTQQIVLRLHRGLCPVHLHVASQQVDWVTSLLRVPLVDLRHVLEVLLSAVSRIVLCLLHQHCMLDEVGLCRGLGTVVLSVAIDRGLHR